MAPPVAEASAEATDVGEPPFPGLILCKALSVACPAEAVTVGEDCADGAALLLPPPLLAVGDKVVPPLRLGAEIVGGTLSDAAFVGSAVVLPAKALLGVPPYAAPSEGVSKADAEAREEKVGITVALPWGEFELHEEAATEAVGAPLLLASAVGEAVTLPSPLFVPLGEDAAEALGEDDAEESADAALVPVRDTEGLIEEVSMAVVEGGADRGAVPVGEGVPPTALAVKILALAQEVPVAQGDEERVCCSTGVPVAKAFKEALGGAEAQGLEEMTDVAVAELINDICADTEAEGEIERLAPMLPLCSTETVAAEEGVARKEAVSVGEGAAEGVSYALDTEEGVAGLVRVGAPDAVPLMLAHTVETALPDCCAERVAGGDSEEVCVDPLVTLNTDD